MRPMHPLRLLVLARLSLVLSVFLGLAAPAAPESAPATAAVPATAGVDRAAQEPSPAPEAPLEPALERARLSRVAGDFGNFYSARRLVRTAAALGVGGVLANTDADQELRDLYQDDVASAGSADLAELADHLGDDWVGPAFALAALGAEWAADGRPAGSAPTEWLRRSGRAMIVGLPAVYYLQQMTGGGRPSDPEGSSWKPFDQSHGISGHAFVGAVPFLTIARQSDSRVVDVLAVAASGLAAWARVDQDEHYPSQVLLGWYLAWEATGAVAQTEVERAAERWSVRPVPLPDGAGVVVTARF